MGRRKERRLAAMSAASRRVKLDLFAEPSGDLGGYSPQNEVGGDVDGTKNEAGLPNSPFTSGKQRENPLVLLGQYSDDELDEESSGEQVQAVSGDTSVIIDDQAKLDAAQGNEDFGFKEGNGPATEKAEHLVMDSPLHLLDSLRKTEVDSPTDNHATESGVMPEEIGLKEQASAISDMPAVEEVILGWKVVFHEETNRYYYWNTATGETSWDVPDVLAQTTESTDGKKDVADTWEKERATDTPMFTKQSTEINGSNAHKPSVEVLNEECKSEMLDETKGNTDLGQNQLKSSSPPYGAQNHVTSPGKSADVLLNEENVNSAESVMYETGAELASSLMKRSEHLLEQLNSVAGSKCNLQCYDQILKYVLEVEMRLADMKSLASYGSSLFPFWLHTERRLQKLETDVHDVLQSLESEEFKEVGAVHESHENICNIPGTNPDEKKAVCSSSGDSGVLESTGITKLQKNYIEVYSGGVSGTAFVSSDGCLATYSDINVGGKGEVDGIAGRCEATPKSLLHSAEEIDMDIDMEVDDATPTSSSTVADPSGVQHHIPSAGQESAAGGEMCSVPPPPEENWIPPPPPDNEPFPPPPPDEPPEIPYPQPSDLVSVQSFSYAEQYTSYTGPNYGYYAQANTDLPSSNLYVTAEVCQPTLSHPAMYFEAVPDRYGPATLAVIPVEPSVYYTLQDGTSQLPMESSVSHSSTVPISSIVEEMSPLYTHVEAESALRPNRVNVPAIDGGPKRAALEIQSSQAYPQDLATTSVTESASLPTVPAATAPVAPATAKAQSKVLRNKKRSVTAVSSLRSNKKVSSLVDKWKAAKEELQEEDEEPKNAYEILEKKRQREIEEWHAQQIASGEARDNANFQPLGGDWRERVKRKRAQLASEPLPTPSDTVTEGNQQPHLDELTRGLPNGWQAYWDDSSKQVYYGNSITSETTWIRPAS